MSILEQAMRKYAPSQSSSAPTDKTPSGTETPVRSSKSTKSPLLEVKDPRPTRSELREDTGSEWSELLENKNGELAEHEIPVAAEMVAITEMREKGIVPDHYTATTECSGCGKVPIFEGSPEKVNGCPWCFNRIKELPVPNPQSDTD